MPCGWKRKPDHNTRSYVSIPCLHYKKLKFSSEKRKKEGKKEREKKWTGGMRNIIKLL